MKFVVNNSLHSALDVGYKENYIEETVNTTLLGCKLIGT